MEPGKLKNSCICGNTLPYLECCGKFAAPHPQDKPAAAVGTPDAGRHWWDFRHALHELYMYLFPLRHLYQAYWERLSREGYPHHLLMADAEYGRAVVANFFWDYSVQFSDARPILRAARDVEGKNLRMANDFRQWGLAPCWLYFVVESSGDQAYLRMAGAEKLTRVNHGGEGPEPGTHVAARLLTYRGEEYLHPAYLAFPRDRMGEVSMETRLRDVSGSLGVRSGAGLRPDVQCEEWRTHGAMFLNWWRELAYDAVVGIPARTVNVAPAFSIPLDDFETAPGRLAAGGAVSLGKGRFELRHRALPVARMELRDNAVHVALLDAAFRSHALRWIAEYLGSVDTGRESTSLEAHPTSVEGMDAWIHTSLPALNGQTPIQASTHEFGRRKLHYLLRELARQGRDISALKRQLGL